MTRMLASVTTLDEARLGLCAGADVIDLKNPSAGALGALPLQTVGEVVRAIDGRRLVSATVGDLPMEPDSLAAAATCMAATGVDFVKIGFFARGDHQACIAALAPLAQSAALIAVFFADQQPDLDLLHPLAAAGFRGVMLDTANKGGGSLRAHLDDSSLAVFVERARLLRLMSGLAGSLRATDVAPLLALQPDFLGFRGALCRASSRTATLDHAACFDIRRRMNGRTAVNPPGDYPAASTARFGAGLCAAQTS